MFSARSSLVRAAYVIIDVTVINMSPVTQVLRMLDCRLKTRYVPLMSVDAIAIYDILSLVEDGLTYVTNVNIMLIIAIETCVNIIIRIIIADEYYGTSESIEIMNEKISNTSNEDLNTDFAHFISSCDLNPDRPILSHQAQVIVITVK